MPPAAANKVQTYELQERVLCFHGPMLYEAKVLDIKKPETKGEPPMYKVHYKGWKNTWDEYVAADRLRKLNDENLLLQKQLTESSRPAPSSKKLSGSSGASRKSIGGSGSGAKANSEDPPSTAPRGQKRGRELEIEKEEDYLRRHDVRITVPDNLKAILVDDWENVTKNQMLVPLPKEPNVRQILEKYRASVPKKRPGSAEADIFDEIIAGLKLYFDKSLGTILLYRFERQQLADIMKEHPGKAMSEIYGAEHLLRLCVSMPELLAHTNMDAQAMSKLRDHIEDFIRFLSKSPEQYIANPYESGTNIYKSSFISEHESLDSGSSLSPVSEPPESRRGARNAARGRGAATSGIGRHVNEEQNEKPEGVQLEEEDDGRDEDGDEDMTGKEVDVISFGSDASLSSYGRTSKITTRGRPRGRPPGRGRGRGRGHKSDSGSTPGPMDTTTDVNTPTSTKKKELKGKAVAVEEDDGNTATTASGPSSSAFLSSLSKPRGSKEHVIGLDMDDEASASVISPSRVTRRSAAAAVATGGSASPKVGRKDDKELMPPPPSKKVPEN